MKRTIEYFYMANLRYVMSDKTVIRTTVYGPMTVARKKKRAELVQIVLRVADAKMAESGYDPLLADRTVQFLSIERN